MDTLLSYRGRTISDSQVAQIAELIAAHPGASRRALSILVCQTCFTDGGSRSRMTVAGPVCGRRV